MVLALLSDLMPTGSREGEERNQGPRISDCWLKLSKYRQCSHYNQEMLMQPLLYHTHRNEYGNTGLLTFSVNVKEELPNSTETEINPHRPTETKLPSQNISFALSFTIPCILNLDCHLSRDWQARFWLGKQRRRQSVPGEYQMLGVLVEGSHWELAKGDLKSR